jgi:predicted RNA-binding protein (virulence factor B family)
MNETMSEINKLVQEVLKMSGSKERFSGAVVGYDQIGNTIFISDGTKTLLAFTDPKHPLQIGDQVTFRMDQFRAIDLRKEIAP